MVAILMLFGQGLGEDIYDQERPMLTNIWSNEDMQEMLRSDYCQLIKPLQRL